MLQLTDNQELGQALSRPERLIADIGGTNTRFALLSPDGEVHQLSRRYIHGQIVDGNQRILTYRGSLAVIKYYPIAN